MINIEVCMGTHCSMMGGLNLYEDIEEIQKQFPEKINLTMAKCFKVCDEGKKTPVIKINDRLIVAAKSEEVISELLELVKK